ncbi:MAG: hypothetical protein WA354_00985 [Terracidiphilus sp.]
MCVRPIAIVVLALALCSAVSGPCQGSPPPDRTLKTPLVYHNAEYGFCLVLPSDWAGFEVLSVRWGRNGKNGESGPKIVVRSPRWTEKKPHQDIPILVFTPEQWRAIENGEFNVSAAPIGPSELGRTEKYVFALPPRFAGFDDAIGVDEVLQLLKQKSFQAQCSTRQRSD